MLVRRRVSPHHYPSLARRWRAVARKARLRLQPLLKVGADQLYYLQTPALAEAGGLYLSAGIHGDEPAGATGRLVDVAGQDVLPGAGLAVKDDGEVGAGDASGERDHGEKKVP